MKKIYNKIFLNNNNEIDVEEEDQKFLKKLIRKNPQHHIKIRKLFSYYIIAKYFNHPVWRNHWYEKLNRFL